MITDKIKLKREGGRMTERVRKEKEMRGICKKFKKKKEERDREKEGREREKDGGVRLKKMVEID